MKKRDLFWLLQTFLLLGLHSSVNVKNIIYSSDNLCFLTFHGETKYNTMNSHALETLSRKSKIRLLEKFSCIPNLSTNNKSLPSQKK